MRVSMIKYFYNHLKFYDETLKFISQKLNERFIEY